MTEQDSPIEGEQPIENEQPTGTSDTDVLYEDHTVRLDETGLTIARYVFPTGKPKRVEYADIVSVDVLPTTWWSRWRLWGSSNFRNWMPSDRTRTKASHLVELDVGGRVRPSFTPRDPDAVAELVRSRIAD